MLIAYEMFLLAAEELNFSRAAQRAFVTQQCASDHIRKLEEQYGVKLFQRRPRLALTPAGEAMYRNLRQMKAIEQSMQAQLGEIKGETTGHFRVGMNPTRARVLLPNTLKRYRKHFPNVLTSFVTQDTNVLEQMLLKNEIDLFLGADTASNPAFARKKLGEDSIHLLARADFFAEHAAISQEAVSQFVRDGIELQCIQRFPVVRNLRESTMNALVDRHLAKNDIVLTPITHISDYDTQIAFCGGGFAAAFCPTMMLDRVLEYNASRKKEEAVLIFPLPGVQERLRIDLVTSTAIQPPIYMERFLECLCDEVAQHYRALQGFKKT